MTREDRHFKRLQAQENSMFQTNQSETFLLRDEARKTTVKPQSGSSVRHVLGGFLSVGEAAQSLGVERITVTRWCQSGKIPATPKAYGRKTTYLISSQVVELLLAEQQEFVEVRHHKRTQAHAVLLPAWKTAMIKGLITGKPFSPRTTNDYVWYIERFFNRHQKLSAKALESELARIPVHQFSKREHLYKASLCFGKFLIREGCLKNEFLNQVKPLRPKRHLPPKRQIVKEAQLQVVLDSCQYSQDRLIVLLLSMTRMCASEAYAIHLQNIDLNNGELLSPLGKGNKARRAGLSPTLVEALQGYRNQVIVLSLVRQTRSPHERSWSVCLTGKN